MNNTTINWLALATREDSREIFRYIYSDGKKLLATNGSALHIHHAHDKPGYYDKALRYLYKQSVMNYPDIDRVIPAKKDRPKTIKYQSLVKFDKEFQTGPVTVYHFDSVMINALYLDNAAIVFENCTIHYRDKNESILIQDGINTAVIMPMKND